MTTGVGGALALGSLVNQFRPRGAFDSPNTLANTATALTGLGTAAYGLAGNKLDNILPTLKRIFGGVAPTTTATAAVSSNLGADPRFSKFVNPDGSFRFRDIVAASDDDLKGTLAMLSPAQRAQMQAQLKNFQPSWSQRIGAKAMGIDVEGQKRRFEQLLGA